jgi:hypothetical protein
MAAMIFRGAERTSRQRFDAQLVMAAAFTGEGLRGWIDVWAD